MYTKGDKVLIWSNSQKSWLDGVVDEAPTAPCMIDGYSLDSGWVKVTSSAGTKYLSPEMVASQLKKAETAAPSGYESGYAMPTADVCTPVDTVTSEDRAKCKFGCGRAVQPGLTRGLKPYDTCCKKCAMTKGQGGHDPNCGKTVKRKTVVVAARQYPVKDTVKKWIANPGSSDFVKALDGALSTSGISGDSFNEEQIKTIITAMAKPFEAGHGQLQLNTLKGCSVPRAALPQFICDIWKIQNELWFPEGLKISSEIFVKQNGKPLNAVFDIGDKLGEGSFGTVYSCTHKISKEKRVVKKILKGEEDDPEASDIDTILMEIGTMARLDHPGIIKVYEYFDESKYVSQIMEPCYGGELQDRIDNVFRHRREAFYGDDFMKDVTKQVLRALAFMHKQRIAHKDLKPQNIMMATKEGSSIKVIDFGLSELFKRGQEAAETSGGTLLYMCPELWLGEAGFKWDVWSTGVILYNMMCGGMPFCGQWPPPRGRDVSWWESETARIICEENPKPNPKVKEMSAQSQDMMYKMLDKDVDVRPDAVQSLEHPWFVSDVLPPTLSVGIVQCLDAYSRIPELKKDIFLLVAHVSSLPALGELRQIFTYFDESNEGTISSTDLRTVLAGASLHPVTADKVIHALDRDGDGSISWTEFTAASICVSVTKNPELISTAFAFFDTNGDGAIDAKELSKVFLQNEADEVKWRSKWPEMIQSVTGKPHGEITKEQFQKYMSEDLVIMWGDKLIAVG
jgi:calcium-dependent protein kinase